MTASKDAQITRTQMKIKYFATVSLAAFLALAANGQGAGGAAGGSAGVGTSSGGTAPGTTGGFGGNSVSIAPGANQNNPTTGAPTPSNPGNISPVNPVRNPNGNTPVVGGGLGANNIGMGTNNLALGTNNAIGTIGSNQFAIRSNNFNSLRNNNNLLTPTGRTNGNAVFLTTNGNAVLINPR
jgi:hypothetical protein